MNCLASGEGTMQYKWEKYQSSSNSWKRPSLRVVNIISPKLIFRVIMEEDEGIYRCVATNHDGSVVSNNATITVYGECTYTLYVPICPRSAYSRVNACILGTQMYMVQ